MKHNDTHTQTHIHIHTNDTQKRNPLKHRRTMTYTNALNQTKIDNNKYVFIYTMTYTMTFKKRNQKTYNRINLRCFCVIFLSNNASDNASGSLTSSNSLLSIDVFCKIIYFLEKT